MRALVFLIVVMFLPTESFSAPSSAVKVCSAATNTFEINVCLAQEMDRLEAKLEVYLSAAEARLKRDGLTEIQLRSAQADWQKYRDAHCADVNTYWQGGTIRNSMVAMCNIRLIEARTQEIWVEFLTYLDSTPPILPKP